MVLFFPLQLHLDEQAQQVEEPNEVDFFKEHENFESNEITVPKVEKPLITLNTLTDEPKSKISSLKTETSDNTLGPSVKLSDTALNTERTPTIGTRKSQPKKVGVRFQLVIKCILRN